MTIERIPNTDVEYYLLAFDKKGHERRDDPDAGDTGLLSDKIIKDLRDTEVTDIFLISHGWKGDIPAAKEQYNRWISSMLACKNDLEKVKQVRPGFRPLLIGLHWPSLPWGDEDFAVSSLSFAPGEDPVASLVEDAADKIADTDRAKEALRVIFNAALVDIAPSTLPPEVVTAYNVLHEEARLKGEGPAGAPGSDAETFNPEERYQAELEEVSFGGVAAGGILSVLRQLSFWKMKDRARIVGESDVGTLLRKILEIAANRDIHIHLMGHSFGCIVVSAAVAGAKGNSPLVTPVHSMFLVQGALSLWAYCMDIPVAKGKAGYFHSIIAGKKVRGPIVTTQSEHDSAVGRLYPLAAGIKGQIVFAPGKLPKYGGLGSFGIRGPKLPINDMKMLPKNGQYGFKNGENYNLESSGVIRRGGGMSGAHSDIAHPEVAHAFWEAVMVA